MNTAVVTFPGSNCDRDMMVAIAEVFGKQPVQVWHRDTALPDRVDFIALPGGFSYGDYLRSGAMAANSPIMREVKAAAARGVPVLGVCNGFQVLAEAGLLPGALMRNAGQRFVCRDAQLKVENTQTRFTAGYAAGETITIPVAHHDGNYFADEATLEDPNTFSRPWTISLPLYRHVAENARLGQFKCVEFVEELMYGHLRKNPVGR